MGNKVATFTEEQLEDYQDCTFFTRKEILRIFKRFREMGDPGVVPRSMTPQQASTIRIPLSCLTRIPELKENPFRQRMSEVFAKRRNTGQSSTTDVEGICFEEFLEMMSVFSEQAPRDLKVFYAFKIYDFDEDGVLGLSDLEHTCRQLVQDGLNADEVATVCRKVLEESDIDGDGVLSYLEFEHVITRASDFMATFHIRI
ncbi:calcium and integrin-binding family member 3 isoform X1 [Hylaeus anthracinus]|uniref:calcium and integrin-binding family member 3 isoform X1 n=1 Tax=Hylaeus volcanicus TaxID=313075 RepID=UPI0023B84FF4|nr:calcium and integrin-binding family member 3 isoform X1 [Hylaeus volcanicus]XP_054006101.1 calcium and integrin-binding family member 3 isoform X1 [Hylaeus anthracinus]